LAEGAPYIGSPCLDNRQQTEKLLRIVAAVSGISGILLLIYIGFLGAPRLARAPSAGLLNKLIWGMVAGAIGLAVYFILIILLRRIPATGKEDEKSSSSRFNQEKVFDEKQLPPPPRHLGFYKKGSKIGLALCLISSMGMISGIILTICNRLTLLTWNMLIWSMPLVLFTFTFYTICQLMIDKRKMARDGKLWKLYRVIPGLIIAVVFGILVILRFQFHLISQSSTHVFMLLSQVFLIPGIIWALWHRAFDKPRKRSRIDQAREIIIDAMESDPKHKDSYLEDLRIINERNKKPIQPVAVK